MTLASGEHIGTLRFLYLRQDREVIYKFGINVYYLKPITVIKAIDAFHSV